MFAQESVMDIQKENAKYLASLLANCGATQDEINDLSFDDEVGFFESNRLADWFVSQINFGWRVWQAAKAQAVPEGFVLVPMVPSERMINAVRQCYEGEAYLPYSLYSEFVNQAIIERMEAQEPTND